ncbi:hypothetical protein, partial [Thiolapillus sp.]|uniref:hypothetical protein n=1 Tax=Thiolapillus sp. TaxID=2017437 RepID=UPI003AF5AB87
NSLGLAGLLGALRADFRRHGFRLNSISTKIDEPVGRWSGLTPGCHIMWYRRDLLFDSCFKIQLKFIFKNVFPILMGAAGQGQQG